ncbi:nucleoside triphosphatase NudI, partial [Escherichia sp. Ec20190506]
MRQRTIVCPLIQNDGAYLLCKMADDRGVFPGQWAISGGGVEPGERIEEALRREIREELGEQLGNDSNLLIVFYVQIMPDDFVMQLHR